MSQVFGDPKRLVNDYMAGSHAIGIILSAALVALPLANEGLVVAITIVALVSLTLCWYRRCEVAG